MKQQVSNSLRPVHTLSLKKLAEALGAARIIVHLRLNGKKENTLCTICFKQIKRPWEKQKPI